MIYLILWIICGAIATPIERRMCIKANGYADKWESPIAFVLGPITLICVAFATIQDYIKRK